MVDSIGVIANMNSMSYRKDKSKVKKVRNILGNKGELIETHDKDDLVKAIQYFLKYKPQVLYGSGGDGNLTTTGTIFRKEVQKSSDTSYNPHRAVYKDGTWNVMSKHVGNKKGDSSDYLEYIVKTELEDLATVDVGEMKVSDDRGKVTYGFSFGFGMPITLLEEAYKAKYLKAVRVVQVIAQLLGSAAMYGEYYKKFAEKKTYKLTNGNGKTEEVELLGLMAQTIPCVGLPWSNIFYKAHDTDKFHVLGAKHDILELTALAPVLYFGKTNFLKRDLLFNELDVKSVLSLLPALYTKNNDLFSHDKLIDKQTDNYNITSEEPYRYTMNGDLAFMDDPYIANSTTIEGGNKTKIIKFLG